MGNQIVKEKFVGKYSGVKAPTLMEPGDISDGKNVRKVSEAGGWKPRRGFTLNNTTAAESPSAINSLHLYENPLHGDRAFITQCNSKLLKATNDPPAAGSTFGTTLGVAVGTTPGFSCVVGESFCYADGSGRPVFYGGLTPYPIAVFSEDASEDEYVEHTAVITDQRTDTEVFVLEAADDKLFVITQEPLSAVILNLGSTVNSNAVTATVHALRSGTYTAVSSLSDGTETGGNTTLAQDGTISWTASASDTMGIVGNTMGYCYKIGWSGAMSNAVDLISVKCTQAAALLTNKWHGTYEWVTGCRVFNGTADVEYAGKVTNVSTSQFASLSSAGADWFLYLKTPEPATGFGIGVVDDKVNTEDAQIDKIEVLEGDTWTSANDIVDTTLDDAADSSFGRTGTVTFEAASLNPTRRTFGGDSFPGYWYRISWDAALSVDTVVYLCSYASFPKALGTYKGCVNFKNRLLLWGDEQWPNRLRASQYDRPSCFTGADAGYLDAMGDMKEILVAANFYNELIVGKADSIWLLEGFNLQTFGTLKITDQVGVASPASFQVIETGYPAMHRDEPLMVAIWQDIDGVYVLDGRKPKKVSGPVDHYFNPEYATCISAANIKSLTSFVDRLNDEYHLLLPDGTELVYNVVTDEWYPPWDRSLTLGCGLTLKGTDNRLYSYGGTSGGFVCRLEHDTSDKNASNADVAIDHSIKTRAIGLPEQQGVTLEFTLRRLWAELKAQTAGNPVVTFYANRVSSGTAKSTPEALSMIKSGYAMTTPGLDLSENNLEVFEIEFSLNVIDQEMELYAMPYELEARGLVNR